MLGYCTFINNTYLEQNQVEHYVQNILLESCIKFD